MWEEQYMTRWVISLVFNFYGWKAINLKFNRFYSYS